MKQYSKEDLTLLLDGQMPWSRVVEIIKDAKDEDRFEKILEILQERVNFKEKILLRLHPHLYIVQKGEARIVKCDCGHEFGDYRVNWKLYSLIYVRDSVESLEEIYPVDRPDPEWCQIREYYCPGCGSQLEVEAMPKGAPPDFEFLPDLDGFYREWLRKPLPDEKEFVDKTFEVIQQWAKK